MPEAVSSHRRPCLRAPAELQACSLPRPASAATHAVRPMPVESPIVLDASAGKGVERDFEEVLMRTKPLAILTAALLLVALSVAVESADQMSGTWKMNAAKSKSVRVALRFMTN